MSQTKTETMDVGDLICGLKAAVTALECQHKMDVEKKQMVMKKHQKPTSPPMYVMIPIEENSSKCNKKNNKKRDTRPNTSHGPNLREKTKAKETRRIKEHKKEEDECAFIPPEMRGGVLFTRCDCIFRNGLQDDCPLTLCQGQPDCLLKPWAECPPGKYYRARHPETYVSPPNPNALTL